MRDFAGKTAVVTGAASGIGFATAARFVKAGMKVVLADWEKDALEHAAQQFAQAGHEVLAVHTDVSHWDSVQNLAARAVEHFGAVHLVHNNAGVIVCSSLVDMTEDDFSWMVNVNPSRRSSRCSSRRAAGTSSIPLLTTGCAARPTSPATV